MCLLSIRWLSKGFFVKKETLEMKKKLYTIIIFSLVFCNMKSQNPDISGMKYGISQMMNLTTLPVLDMDARVKYEGSIDKKGANADWDWSLYKDERNEWVVFDVSGPGCIYNFVQHRYISCEEPIFRFYFDGDPTPRFEIKPSQFGEKYPFEEPLASKYIGPTDNGRGPIRVVRSFVPMAFRKCCRVTSSIKLEGADRAKGEGGWGHIIYHQFTTPAGVETFTGKEDYTPLIQMWKNVGSNPIPTEATKPFRIYNRDVASGENLELMNQKTAGSVASVRLLIGGMKPSYLENVWIYISWDEHEKADISCPIGSFFGNSIGLHDTNYLLMSASIDGLFNNFFPMPFWKSAKIWLKNRGTESLKVDFAEIKLNQNTYDASSCGYFRNSPYYTRKNTPAKDSPIATIGGAGKMVAAHITCYAKQPNVISCEGDVRVHIDGNRTPQVESDGSESYVCYGWGFPTPAESHPSGGYDGLPDNPWSMTRLCLGDSYSFGNGLQFSIESGENNNQYLEHEGCVFYYGKDTAKLVLSDSVDLASEQSLRKHKYRIAGFVQKNKLKSFFEGDSDDIAVNGTTISFTGSSTFVVKIYPGNKGIKLRRMSDQLIERQRAKVFVDGQEVVENEWYFADGNPFKRWLEDEFVIPSKYAAGKTALNIKIVPVIDINTKQSNWNESYYRIFCYI